MFKIKVFTSKSGRDCIALIHVSDYTTYVTFDINVISRITKKTLRELYTLPYGEYDI